jgi:tRNA A37 N6-isopentenylltransferase MiaA
MRELGLEYGALADFLDNKISKEEMIERLKKEIWHYAKRQMTWFKKPARLSHSGEDKNTIWLSPKISSIEKEANKFL